MKILHTSDWHIGITENDRSLYDDQKYFIDALLDVVRNEKIDAVMIAGDVYDRSVASAEAVKLYDYAMRMLCMELGVKVLMIAGNHDSAERLASCSDLLESAGLYIRGALSRDLSPVCLGDTEIYLLPWIMEEKVKSIFPENAGDIKSLEDAYKVVTDKMRASFDPRKKHIAVAHAFVTGGETSTSDRAAEIGFAAQISAKVFEGFDYTALGHLHKPQKVTENVRYSGTPMPYSFGNEEKHEKSVTVIDTETMEQKIIPLTLLHERHTLEGTLDELEHPTCSDEVRNGYVRLQVTDSWVGGEILANLRDIYPALLEVSGLTLENDEETETMSIEEFEAIEKDPVEVFRRFCKAEMGVDIGEHQIRLFEEARKKAAEDEK